MAKPAAYRLELDPALRYFKRCDHGRIGHDIDADTTLADFADLLIERAKITGHVHGWGTTVSRVNVKAWKQRGVLERTAEHIAVLLGVDPFHIWGEEWEHVNALALLDLDDEEG